MKRLLMEAGVVGVILVLIVVCMLAVFKKDYYSANEVIVLSFLSGVAAHALFELSGANKWYCKNGHACLNIT